MDIFLVYSKKYSIWITYGQRTIRTSKTNISSKYIKIRKLSLVWLKLKNDFIDLVDFYLLSSLLLSGQGL